jgi:DNA-binding CsgD family transcriptional regulator
VSLVTPFVRVYGCPAVLVGRQVERARIDELLERVRRGRSGTLVVRGEPGIGKTALLEDAERSARGMRILRTRGIESEGELAYAGLITLARPLFDLVPELPQPQAEALAGALALGPAPTAQPLAVCAATLGVLTAATEETAVLVLVDDAHWLDPETAQTLGFAARRLANERIAMLFALRDGEQSTFATDGLDELVVTGLPVEDARELLGGRVVDSVATRLADVTTGNPLALLELVDTLSKGQRAGVEPVSEPVPVGEALEQAFGRRLAELPDAARTALVVAAAAGERDDVAFLARAWSRLEIAARDTAVAERARLVSREDGRLRFRHPLVRAAAYAGAAGPDRRAAHASLAAVLEVDADADERAWHVALAAEGPEEEAAATIEAAGRRAYPRSRHAALRALERAAALTPYGEARTRRYLAAADAAIEAGAWQEAAALLVHEDAAAAAGELASERLYLRGIVASRHEATSRPAAELLERAAAQLAGSNPEHAALAEVRASQAWLAVMEHEQALSAARRAAALPFEPGGKTELAVLLALGDTAAWAGQLDQAVAFWRRVAPLADIDDPEQLQMAGEALFSAGDDEEALSVIERAESVARERAALGTLTTALLDRALCQTRIGDLQAARADAGECVSLMRAIGQPAEQAEALGLLSWIEAMLGREEECRRHVEEAHTLLRSLGFHHTLGRSPIGLLELSLGRPEEAADALGETMRLRADRGDAEVIAPRLILPSYIEALARAGKTEEATAQLAGRLGAARRTGRPHAIAQFLRCRGVVDGDEGSFREALEWHERWSNRWERARTELCYGELLRRLKRRGEARLVLRAALDGFEKSGAVLWAERARTELRATGERARRRDPSTADELTPQELQVARLVATGLTNRDVAARLFLSPKTIETHLGNVFRKTGVRTRAELAHRFRDSPDSIAASGA